MVTRVTDDPPACLQTSLSDMDPASPLMRRHPCRGDQRGGGQGWQGPAISVSPEALALVEGAAAQSGWGVRLMVIMAEVLRQASPRHLAGWRTF